MLSVSVCLTEGSVPALACYIWTSEIGGRQLEPVEPWCSPYAPRLHSGSPDHRAPSPAYRREVNRWQERFKGKTRRTRERSRTVSVCLHRSGDRTRNPLTRDLSHVPPQRQRRNRPRGSKYSSSQGGTFLSLGRNLSTRDDNHKMKEWFLLHWLF